MRIHLCFVCYAIALTSLGCGASEGTSGAGGGGGGGGGATENVVGTRHDCATMPRNTFIAACEEQGGLLADGCSSGATNPCDSAGTCYLVPPAPQGSEFSCDGLFNCAVGQGCYVYSPSQDGCGEHECFDLPADCGMPVCDCLTPGTPQVPSGSCSEDAQGNPTITDNF